MGEDWPDLLARDLKKLMREQYETASNKLFAHGIPTFEEAPEPRRGSADDVVDDVIARLKMGYYE